MEAIQLPITFDPKVAFWVLHIIFKKNKVVHIMLESCLNGNWFGAFLFLSLRYEHINLFSILHKCFKTIFEMGRIVRKLNEICLNVVLSSLIQATSLLITVG